jgi:hypothetical protein
MDSVSSDPGNPAGRIEPPKAVYESMHGLMMDIQALHRSLQGIAEADGLPWWHTDDIRAFDRMLGMFASRLLIMTPMDFWAAYAERIAELSRQGLWHPKG